MVLSGVCDADEVDSCPSDCYVEPEPTVAPTPEPTPAASPPSPSPTPPSSPPPPPPPWDCDLPLCLVDGQSVCIEPCPVPPVADDAVRIGLAFGIDTPDTHGTGCTFAAALATGLGSGLSIGEAFIQAVRFVRLAILNAPGLGEGHGPVGHALGMVPFDVVDGADDDDA